MARRQPEAAAGRGGRTRRDVVRPLPPRPVRTAALHRLVAHRCDAGDVPPRRAPRRPAAVAAAAVSPAPRRRNGGSGDRSDADPDAVRRPWLPACLSAHGFSVETVQALSYVVLDEIVGNHATLTVSPWPAADGRGRL